LARAALHTYDSHCERGHQGAISLQQARTVFKTARWLVHDRDRFAAKRLDGGGRRQFSKDIEGSGAHTAGADEVRSFTCGLLFLPTEARRALRQELEGSVVAVLGLPSKGTTKGTNARNLGHKK
jgi:hypothetical protein